MFTHVLLRLSIAALLFVTVPILPVVAQDEDEPEMTPEMTIDAEEAIVEDTAPVVVDVPAPVTTPAPVATTPPADTAVPTVVPTVTAAPAIATPTAQTSAAPSGASCSAQPAVSISTPNVAVGQSFSWRAIGFAPGTILDFYWTGSTSPTGPVNQDSVGEDAIIGRDSTVITDDCSVSFTSRFPNQAPGGVYVLRVQGIPASTPTSNTTVAVIARATFLGSGAGTNTPPLAPSTFSADGDNRQIILSWTDSLNTGANYVITLMDSDDTRPGQTGKTWTAQPASRTLTVTGLLPGARYCFTIAAVKNNVQSTTRQACGRTTGL